MKLKYYLRGAGIGIIIATIIMTVSSVVHNNNLSNETIIKEAMKLGMVMPEQSETEGGLWGKNEEETEIQDSTETESAETTENSEQVISSEEPIQEEVVQEETPSVQPPTTKVPVGTLVEITVKDGDAARQVAETLYANGLIPDAEEFRLYLGAMGYASHIYTGTFQIPMGASYEEICNIIIKKQF